jgi:UDP-N-acetylmuramoyl-L-alanyl-D-glutamate--2,6-diaminopimelate ligase
MFFALPGLHVDGHDHIVDAIRNGAVAVVHTRSLATYLPGTTFIQVKDSRFAMSPAADAFWSSPSQSLAVIGVTGTEGKSTTVWLTYRLLDLAGKRAGFISTVEYRIADTVLPNPEHQTTPEATTIHAKLATMLEHGLEYVVLEASSHGLSARTNRLGDIRFDVGIITNIRHEHLEFHGSWEQYRDDKTNLLRRLAVDGAPKTIGGRMTSLPAFGVICHDDPSAAYCRAASAAPVYSYSMHYRDDATSDSPCPTIYAMDIRPDNHGACFRLVSDDQQYACRLNLPGEFNVENCLAAVLAVAKLTGIPIGELVPLLPQLEPVRGRMTRIDADQPFEVIVDYAHTPTSFSAILPPLRERIKGKLLCVFGSGGERDTLKRPEQGRIAAQYCDIIILSDEDPRGEDPMTLLEEIATGCGSKSRGKDLFLIPDRAMAIRKALAMASTGDMVLLLGKGHENSIIYASGSIPWDEINEARLALAEAGYKRKSI